VRPAAGGTVAGLSGSSWGRSSEVRQLRPPPVWGGIERNSRGLAVSVRGGGVGRWFAGAVVPVLAVDRGHWTLLGPFGQFRPISPYRLLSKRADLVSY
jgi:hypothetical protein